MTTTELPEIDVPFIPSNDDMDAIYNGIGVTEFDNGVVIALTTDRQDARAAFVAHLNSQGSTVTADEDLNVDLKIGTFIRPSVDDENAWLFNQGGTEGPFTTVAWLEA